MPHPFAQRLEEAIRRKGTPAMVGIDPQWELLPEPVRTEAVRLHGPTLKGVVSAYRRFIAVVVEQVAAHVGVVKFQSAFFEAAGPEGLSLLAEVIDWAAAAGLVVVLDGKRNDIGSTAQAYAQAYLGAWTLDGHRIRPWHADALTVNAFLGADGIEPFLRFAVEEQTGLFVLVRTSNPSAGWLQERRTEGKAVFEEIADQVEQWSLSTAAGARYGAVGAVVGATAADQIAGLRGRMPHAWLLLPGYGAQGGSAADTAPAFHADGTGALVNSSRGILYAYRDHELRDRGWESAISRAALTMVEELAQRTPAGVLRAS